jgi:hydrogenase expression/formation protein
MSDLEGLARNLLKHGQSSEEILDRLVEEIQNFKDIGEGGARPLAEAVLEEVQASDRSADRKADLLSTTRAGVSMGEFGVGCRGTGDFFVHRLVADISKPDQEVALSPQDMDDAGALELGEGQYLVAKMEGMHSRLSDFPFLAGFHVTRAAIRDLLVKGAFPSGVMVDIHLADDADIGKLFDFMSGVRCICRVVNCPILGGSTLRIGGDMVIGTRMTGGVSAFGFSSRILPRRDVVPGDAIIMTEGAGGGTICTTAIYSGRPEVVDETINIKFVVAARAVLSSEYAKDVHCMADVTNGGLRADLHEIADECGSGSRVFEDKILSLPNPRVREMLDELEIDVLGVSLDSLLVFCRWESAEDLVSLLRRSGVEAEIIGRTTSAPGVKMVTADGESSFIPRFRESAYTKIKKVVDHRPETETYMEESLVSAARKAEARAVRVAEMLAREFGSLRS